MQTETSIHCSVIVLGKIYKVQIFSAHSDMLRYPFQKEV